MCLGQAKPSQRRAAMRRGLTAGALAVATFAGMPMQAAVAAEPYREQVRPLEGVTGTINLPAGLGCSFAVRIDFELQGISWQFNDGHQVANNVATQTLTNLDTGTSYVHRSDYHTTDTVAADGTIVDVIDGTFLFLFFPGDQGPVGEVGPDGALYGLIGHFTAISDPVTDVVTSFEGDGQASDLCQILSA
jgi:hypothetical protein